MSKTAIVNSGHQFFIKQMSENKAITLDKVIFAYIDGVKSDTEIDPNTTMPKPDQIVHTMNVTKTGLINDRTVVYSAILDTSIGDFEFNFIGLVNAETNTLCMVLHTDKTKKVKTKNQNQGNTITESIWLELDNASDTTGINISAETWQVDFSKRFTGEDEIIRQTNLDLYGRLGITDGLNITKDGNNIEVSAGVCYVAGLRVNQKQKITIQAKNGQSIYIDASLQGTTTGEWTTKHEFKVGDNLKDYHDGTFMHYVERIAQIDSGGNIQKIKSYKFLTELNKSSSIDSDSEDTVPTTKLFKQTIDNIKTKTNTLSINSNDTLDITPPGGAVTLYAQKNGEFGFYERSTASYPFVFNPARGITFRGIKIPTVNEIYYLGEFKLFPFSARELPKGWYFRNGDRHRIDSNIGKALKALSAEFKTNWGIVEKNDYINIPNAFNEGGDGYFERPVNGDYRQVGSMQGDSIRNITGNFSRKKPYQDSKPEYYNGVFRLTSNGGGRCGGSTDYDSVLINFDASLVVPTSHENRPINIGMTPAIYLGV